MDLPPVEVRIGVGGNVDAGKSSFVGVITKGILDNGRGYARSFVLLHKHEQDTGRTSSVSQQYIRQKEKIIEFNDLAGHEKYYKCTARQLATTLLDYVVIVINSGSGIQMMTREHISLAFSLRIPMFIVFTKIDSTPSNVYESNLEYIKSFYKQKMNLEVKVIDTTSSKSDIIPLPTLQTVILFPVSNVSGQGIDIVREYIISLNKTIDYTNELTKPANFLIHRIYQVQGIGIVVSGVMKTGIVKKNDVLYLGPNATGFTVNPDTNIIISPSTGKDDLATSSHFETNHPSTNFYKISVRGIHNNFKESIDYLSAGYSGCFNIKAFGKATIKRSMIRPGMRLLSDINSVFQFQAKIKICNTNSTITKRYQPVLHCGGISQAVQIVAMDKEYLRSYDDATVTFRFLYRPEYLEVGNIFIMREGNLKALGKVIKINM
jgi:GTPase